MTAPRRGDDREATRSTRQNADSLDHQVTASARLDVAMSYLEAGLLEHDIDTARGSEYALRLIVAAKRDLAGVI